MHLRVASILGMAMLGSAMQIKGSSSAQMQQQRVTSVIAEAERQCAQRDMDAATKTLALWYRPDQPAISQDQLRSLLNVCLAQYGFLGEVGWGPTGSKCLLEEVQCNWAKRCLDNDNCASPPATETVALIEKQHAVAKHDFHDGEDPHNPAQGDRIMKKEPQGVWVDGCEHCNLAMTIAYTGMNNLDSALTPDKTNTKHSFFWDKVVPLILKVKDPTGDETLDENQRAIDTNAAVKHLNEQMTVISDTINRLSPMHR